MSDMVEDSSNYNFDKEKLTDKRIMVIMPRPQNLWVKPLNLSPAGGRGGLLPPHRLRHRQVSMTARRCQGRARSERPKGLALTPP